MWFVSVNFIYSFSFYLFIRLWTLRQSLSFEQCLGQLYTLPYLSSMLYKGLGGASCLCLPTGHCQTVNIKSTQVNDLSSIWLVKFSVVFYDFYGLVFKLKFFLSLLFAVLQFVPSHIDVQFCNFTESIEKGLTMAFAEVCRRSRESTNFTVQVSGTRSQ